MSQASVASQPKLTSPRRSAGIFLASPTAPGCPPAQKPGAQEHSCSVLLLTSDDSLPLGFSGCQLIYSHPLVCLPFRAQRIGREMSRTGKEQAPPLWEYPPNTAQRGCWARAFPHSKPKAKHAQEPIQVPQALGKRLLSVPGQSRPGSCRGCTHTGRLSPPREAPAAEGRRRHLVHSERTLEPAAPVKTKPQLPGTGRLLQDPPWPGTWLHPPVWAFFPAPGSLQLGRGQSAHCPDTSQPPQAWPFLRQHTRGPGPWTHTDVMACLPPPLPGHPGF